MEFKEIEFKYDAAYIELEKFISLMETFPIKKKIMVSGYDDYFADAEVENFIRYRHRDDWGQITVKRKLSEHNNNERIEINIPTDGDILQAVTALVDTFKYKHNFTIFSTCKIYWVDKVCMVYYVVYDKELRELRRFVEIEADEKLHWSSEDEAWGEITKYERLLEPLGITPKNRLKKSLFETFRKVS